MAEERDFDARVGDVGFIIEVPFVDEEADAIDISTATTKQIKIQRPDGSRLTKTASFSGTGTDGKIQVATVSTDLNSVGLYEYQGYAVWSSGAKDKHTALGFFWVGKKIAAA